MINSRGSAFSPAVDTHIIGTALATAHRPFPRPRHAHLSLSSQKVQIEKTNSMSAVPEGEDQRTGGPVSGPFANKRELLRVVHCCRFSCSTDVTVRSAVAKGADVVLIDTAGRLHNRIDLMNELTKIRNVMRKVIPDAPHEVLLVLDGSTGQNAFQQAKEFSRATEVTALAVTKLDGTAKGGVVIGIVDQFRIPVKFVGIGEGVDDLKTFNKREFVNSLFSKEDLR